MLKTSASFYDPLVLISRVVNLVKIIFQVLCKGKLDWNEKTLEIETVWRIFLSDLENWKFLKVKLFPLC